MRRWLLALPLVLVLLAPPAVAQRAGAAPVLHEPIPADAREDVALAVSLDGDIPAAINTPHGPVSAPDPAKPIGTAESPYNHAPGDARDTSFRPDRDTRRPDVLPYDDPFSPSTAPFKRLSAFDSVDASYTLSVRDPHTTPLPVAPAPAPDASEEQFYADMVVDVVAGQKVRIPSVGPGARVLRARAGVGTQDVRFQLWKDGAENWFIEAESTTRARIVMAVSVPRMAFGGDFGNPSWAELPPVTPPLPPSVQRAANEVAAKIGVSRRLSPREDVTKLVTYFRGFTDSEDPPSSTRDIYLDLALSRKGVCRHRAFAFMVTALHLGLPTRMVVNEAHAWVEVNDGRLWRRIDLGGAGRTLHDPLSTNVPHDPPPDPFSWPQGSTRGDDLADRARQASASGPNATPKPAPSGAASGANASTAPTGSAPSPAGSGGGADGNGPPSGFGASGGRGRGNNGTSKVDDRPPAIVTLALAGADAHRGAPFKVRGQVSAEGEPCGHVTVEVVLRGRAGDLVIGQLATDERGAYDGAIVLPAVVPLGDYDIQARTLGDGRCGLGFSR